MNTNYYDILLDGISAYYMWNLQEVFDFVHSHPTDNIIIREMNNDSIVSEWELKRNY